MNIKKSEHDILEISWITLYNTLKENAQIKIKSYGLLSYCIVNENLVLLKKQNQQVSCFQGRLQNSKYITSCTIFVHQLFLENVIKNKQLCENKQNTQLRSCLDDWLTVHRSITLVDLQLDVQNSYLFTYNTFVLTRGLRTTKVSNCTAVV